MFDVIVVGARCSGSPLARRLALAGHRVALVDRSTFPSDTVSTHFLWQRAAARLEGWGLRAELERRGCTPIHELVFDVGPVRLRGIGPAEGGVSATYCPRRTVLDSMLVDAAVDAGAELIEGFVVDDILWSGGRAGGVVGHRRSSTTRITLEARMVVGADGRHSSVATRVGATTYDQYPALTGVYYSYWSGLTGLGASFHARPGRLVLVWPTNDDLTCIYLAWPHHEMRRVRRDLDRAVHEAFGLVPGLREAVSSGRREEPYAGTRDLPNFYRASAGRGWALAGDAGHHKDPCTGLGITDAFVSADLLFDALNDGLTGTAPLDEALCNYHRRRDAATADGYALTLSAARLAPVSLRLERFYRRAAEDPELIQRIFGVLGGSLKAEDVFPRSDRLAGTPPL